MSTIVDIVIAILIVLGTYYGARKGLIKTFISFIGLVSIVILSYTLKTYLANFLIDTLPFFNFSGSLEGLTALNILIYNIISFVVIFIILYCILNVILSLTGFVDTLLKFTVIWVIPSKIGGALLGFFETWVFIFLVLFVISQLSFLNITLRDSKLTNIILNHTPMIGSYLLPATVGGEEIYNAIVEYKNDESKTNEDLNLFILQTEINAGLISKEKATELIEIGKIGLGNVMFGKGDNKWLNT